MLVFSNCKINIGLNILKRLENGYHEIETVFYPAPWIDAVEIIESNELKFESSGLRIPGDPSQNLCLKAYQLIKAEYDIPPVTIHLRKKIPIGAGLGGGSSNAVASLKALNSLFELNINDEQFRSMASSLGADCSFFIDNNPVYASGIGNEFLPVNLNLSNYQIVIIYPNKLINTNWAYAQIQLKQEKEPYLLDAIDKPIEQWKDLITNDFEREVNKVLPQVKKIKEQLYEIGAVYTQMSGSGSCIYGIFDKTNDIGYIEDEYQKINYLTKTGSLNPNNLFETKF